MTPGSEGSLDQSQQQPKPATLSAAGPGPQAQDARGRDAAQLVYVLQAAGILIGLSWVAGAIVNWVKRDEPRADWVRTHFDAQNRSFWIWVFGVVLAAVLKAQIGWPVAAAVTIWLIVRIVKGWLALRDGRPAPAGWI